MPTPRALAIVTCSCGLRIGSIARASECEDMEAFELAFLATKVPVMKRHFELGHSLKLRDGLPLAYAAVIAKAARELAGDAAPVTGETGPVRQ